MKIVFITVSYNNFVSTKEYIESFLSLDNSASTRLIVVDNSIVPDEKLRSLIEKLPETISYVRQNENNGYMAACNYGYKLIRSDLDADSVVIYSNNDLIFNTSDMIDKITFLFNNDSSLGVLSPKVIDVHTSLNLNPFLTNRPKLLTFFKLKLLYLNYFVCDIYHKFKRTSHKNIKSSVKSEIYATHGCIFIMSNKILDELPDDEYFLYGEEVTIAELCRRLSYSTKYFDEISVSHVSHATTGNGFSKSQFKNKKNAINYILGRYKW
ncbi:glycosyltransferase family 2 protein [Shewanella mangrovisoli]|uniref:Glycosyltransferase family 2 protein n=1 Tax=Shewanella mangrovisoli TaxID=2864211 RepID=A0ABV4VFZ8_9GAMM